MSRGADCPNCFRRGCTSMQNAVKPKLLEQVREKIRVKHYSIRTEKAYVDWIKRFILFHGKKHPAQRDVSASTQNQALSAILFLYKEVLNQQLGRLDGFERAKRPARLPVVLSPAQVRAVLAHLDGVMWLMASLL